MVPNCKKIQHWTIKLSKKFDQKLGFRQEFPYSKCMGFRDGPRFLFILKINY